MKDTTTYTQDSDLTYEVRPADGLVVIHFKNKQTKWEIGSLIRTPERAQEVAENLTRFAALLEKK